MGKSGPPFTKRREKNSLSNFSIVIDVEGGLISDLFSLWLHPPNNMPNHYPEHFLYWLIVLRIVIRHIFWKIEKLLKASHF